MSTVTFYKKLGEEALTTSTPPQTEAKMCRRPPSHANPKRSDRFLTAERALTAPQDTRELNSLFRKKDIDVAAKLIERLSTLVVKDPAAYGEKLARAIADFAELAQLKESLTKLHAITTQRAPGWAEARKLVKNRYLEEDGKKLAALNAALSIVGRPKDLHVAVEGDRLTIDGKPVRDIAEKTRGLLREGLAPYLTEVRAEQVKTKAYRAYVDEQLAALRRTEDVVTSYSVAQKLKTGNAQERAAALAQLSTALLRLKPEDLENISSEVHIENIALLGTRLPTVTVRSIRNNATSHAEKQAVMPSFVREPKIFKGRNARYATLRIMGELVRYKEMELATGGKAPPTMLGTSSSLPKVSWDEIAAVADVVHRLHRGKVLQGLEVAARSARTLGHEEQARMKRIVKEAWRVAPDELMKKMPTYLFWAQSGASLAAVKNLKASAPDLESGYEKTSKLMSRTWTVVTLGLGGSEKLPGIDLRFHARRAEQNIVQARALMEKAERGEKLTSDEQSTFLSSIKNGQSHLKWAVKDAQHAGATVEDAGTTSFVIGLGVTATALLATYVTAGAAAPYAAKAGAGAWAVHSAIGAATFTAVQTAANVSIYDERFRLAHMGEDFATNFVTFAVLGRVMRAMGGKLGKLSPEELAARAKELGIAPEALTWLNRQALTYGVAEGAGAARILGTKLAKEGALFATEAMTFQGMETAHLMRQVAGLTTRARPDLLEGLDRLWSKEGLAHGLLMLAGIKGFNHVIGTTLAHTRARTLNVRITPFLKRAFAWLDARLQPTALMSFPAFPGSRSGGVHSTSTLPENFTWTNGAQGVLAAGGTTARFEVTAHEGERAVRVWGEFSGAEKAEIASHVRTLNGELPVRVVYEQPSVMLTEKFGQNSKVAFEGKEVFARGSLDRNGDVFEMNITVDGSFANEAAVRTALKKTFGESKALSVDVRFIEPQTSARTTFNKDAEVTALGDRTSVYWTDKDGGAWVLQNEGSQPLFYRTIKGETKTLEAGKWKSLPFGGWVLTPNKGYRWEFIGDYSRADTHDANGAVVRGGVRTPANSASGEIGKSGGTPPKGTIRDTLRTTAQDDAKPPARFRLTQSFTGKLSGMVLMGLTTGLGYLADPSGMTSLFMLPMLGMAVHRGAHPSGTHGSSAAKTADALFRFEPGKDQTMARHGDVEMRVHEGELWVRAAEDSSGIIFNGETRTTGQWIAMAEGDSVTIHGSNYARIAGELRPFNVRGENDSPLIVERHDTQGQIRKVVAAGAESIIVQNGDGTLSKISRHHNGAAKLDGEQQALALLQHHGIDIAPRLIGRVRSDEFVMERVPGRTLEGMNTKQRQEIPESSWNRFERDVQRMNDLGVMHNDVHAGNIIYDPATKTLRLLDFDNSTVGHKSERDIIDVRQYRAASQQGKRINNIYRIDVPTPTTKIPVAEIRYEVPLRARETENATPAVSVEPGRLSYMRHRAAALVLEKGGLGVVSGIAVGLGYLFDPSGMTSLFMLPIFGMVVNAKPGSGFPHHPNFGQARGVARTILDMWFDPANNIFTHVLHDKRFSRIKGNQSDIATKLPAFVKASTITATDNGVTIKFKYQHPVNHGGVETREATLKINYPSKVAPDLRPQEKQAWSQDWIVMELEYEAPWARDSAGRAKKIKIQFKTGWQSSKADDNGFGLAHIFHKRINVSKHFADRAEVMDFVMQKVIPFMLETSHAELQVNGRHKLIGVNSHNGVKDGNIVEVALQEMAPGTFSVVSVLRHDVQPAASSAPAPRIPVEKWSFVKALHRQDVKGMRKGADGVYEMDEAGRAFKIMASAADEGKVAVVSLGGGQQLRTARVIHVKDPMSVNPVDTDCAKTFTDFIDVHAKNPEAAELVRTARYVRDTLLTRMTPDQQLEVAYRLQSLADELASVWSRTSVNKRQMMDNGARDIAVMIDTMALDGVAFYDLKIASAR